MMRQKYNSNFTGTGQGSPAEADFSGRFFPELKKEVKCQYLQTDRWDRLIRGPLEALQVPNLQVPFQVGYCVMCGAIVGCFVYEGCLLDLMLKFFYRIGFWLLHFLEFNFKSTL